MRFQFYCLDVIALAFRILGKNSNQFSVWMYKRIELVFVLLRPGPIRPSSARRSSRSASSMPPSSWRRRARSPGRGGVARRRLRGRDGATRCCCFCRGARAWGEAAAARATGLALLRVPWPPRGGARREEEGRAHADPPLRDGLHRASPHRRGGSSAAHGPRRRGARPPSMEGVEERRSPRGGTAEACPSTTAQAAPPSRAGPPHPAPRVRPPPGRAEPSRAAGVEGEGSPEWKARGSGGMREGDEMRANADEYRG